MQLIIFDLDGTLIDSKYDLANSLKTTALSLNYPYVAANEIPALLGDGAGILVAKAFGLEPGTEKHKEALALFMQNYSENLCGNTVIYPKVKETLQRLVHKKLAVLSNKPDAFTKQIIATLGFSEYFSFVLGQTATLARKPHPDGILHILKQFQIAPENALMVGDGDTDIACGKAAGVKTCAVTYGYRKREELEYLNPDFFIDSLDELIELIE